MTSESSQAAFGDGTRALPPSVDDVGPWIERLVRHDPTAAAWLYDTFADGLARRIRGRYGYLDPEDLLQDAFLFYFQNEAKVLRAFLERVPEGERTERRLAQHLWDLACGLAANRRRASKVRSGTSAFEDGAEERIEDPKTSVEEQATDRDALRRLDHCLRQRGQRLALYYRFRFWDGCSPAEIAEITGWSMKATYKLRQALSRAVEACVEKLGLARAAG